MNLLDTSLNTIVDIADSRRISKNLRQIDRIGRDARVLKEFLAEARGVEGIRTSANGADTHAAKTSGNFANLREPQQIFTKAWAGDRDGVIARQAVLESELAEVVADGDFPA